MILLSILRKFICNKKNEKDKHIQKLKIVEKHLEERLCFWNEKCMEEKKMIQLLQNRIAYLSDKIEDARDMLFSEVDYHERSFATECENFLKLQSKIKIGKRKCEELGRLIKNYKLQQSLMKKQLEQMNSRIEENKKYSDYLLRRKDRADLLAEYWRNQVAQALQPNVSFSMSPVREIL